MSYIDTSPSFINRSKAVSNRLQVNGIYVAVVTKVMSNSIYVSVPKLGADSVYGPCAFSGALPTAGEFVFVTFLDGRLSELVCLGVVNKALLPASSPVFDDPVIFNKLTTFNNKIVHQGYETSVLSTLLTTDNATQIDMFSMNQYRSATYTIDVKQGDNYAVMHALAVHNGAAAQLTVYGITSTAPLDLVIELTCNGVGTNVLLYAKVDNADVTQATVTARRTALKIT